MEALLNAVSDSIDAVEIESDRLGTCSREPSASVSTAVCSRGYLFAYDDEERAKAATAAGNGVSGRSVVGWRRTMRGGASVDVLAIARYEANGPSMCGVRHDRAPARHNARSRTNDRTSSN